MKFFLLSDKLETYTGLRLSGIDGVVVHTQKETIDAIEATLHNPEIGILLITEGLTKLCRPLLDEIKLNRPTPLVVELPDRHGTARSKDSITRYVRDAIGIKV